MQDGQGHSLSRQQMLVPGAMFRGRSLVACLFIGSTYQSLHQTSAFRPTHARRGHSSLSLLPGMAGGDDGVGDGPFPELAVFDLDACFWDQESELGLTILVARLPK